MVTTSLAFGEERVAITGRAVRVMEHAELIQKIPELRALEAQSFAERAIEFRVVRDDDRGVVDDGSYDAVRRYARGLHKERRRCGGRGLCAFVICAG